MKHLTKVTVKRWLRQQTLTWMSGMEFSVTHMRHVTDCITFNSNLMTS